MANAAQTPDAPASAGQLLWSQPNICDNILSHLPRDDQVALMTVNNNTFQYVIRWRYDWIYGEVLAHLDYVRTPEARLSQYLSRTTLIDLVGSLNSPLPPVLELFDMCPHLERIEWLDGVMTKQKDPFEEDAKRYAVEYDVELSDDLDEFPACWAYSSQLARIDGLANSTRVSRRVTIDCSVLRLLTLSLPAPQKQLLTGPIASLNLYADDYFDLAFATLDIAQHRDVAEEGSLSPSSPIRVQVANWIEFWDRLEEGLPINNLFKLWTERGYRVCLSIGRQDGDYWHQAAAQMAIGYWNELAVVGALADTAELRAPFVPLDTSNNESIPPGPDDYSARAHLQKLTFSMRLPIAHSDLLDDPSLLERIQKGFEPYADMIARMCGPQCELDLEAVIEAAEGFDESVVGVDTPARLYWQARMEEMMAASRRRMMEQE